MLIRACAFTTEGWNLVRKIANGLPDYFFDMRKEGNNLEEWIKDSFQLGAPILFVGAIGIAVRKIAPYISNKLTDSPVIVVDECGRYMIPLLSDHVGGAGEIARNVASLLEAQVVLTAATDIHNLFSVDVFARKNGLVITDKDGIKRVSAKLLKEGAIRMAIAPSVEYSFEEIPEYISIVEYGDPSADVVVQTTEESLYSSHPLYLIYKPFVIGVGCKKNTPFERLDGFIKENLSIQGIDINLVARMASIDLKKEECGLLYFECKNRIPFTVYTAEELDSVEGNFSISEYVRSVTGVSNVCERAAMKASGEGAQLIVKKIVQDGMTLAVSRRKARLVTWET